MVGRDERVGFPRIFRSAERARDVKSTAQQDYSFAK